MPSRNGRRAGRRTPAAPNPTPAECVTMLADALVPHNSSVSALSLDEVDPVFLDEVYGTYLPALSAEQALDVDALSAALRLHAGLLRPCSGTDSASAGFELSADDTELRQLLLDGVLEIARSKCEPGLAARDALTLLRILRAMLRAQTLHALSRQLAAAAAALEPYGGGAGSGAGDAAAAAAATEQGRAALVGFFDHTSMFGVVLFHGVPFAGLSCDSPELAAGVAAERAAGVEELARGLAESGVLEHAARVLLLLQARGPHAVRPREGAEKTLAWEVLDLIYWLGWWAPGPSCISPAAAAQLRSTLSGRCVQTAVLVYGVGTLRLVDRGPTYGLPAALQTAGLSMCEVGQRSPGPLILDLLLRQLASRGALPPPGPGASLELALRVGRAAVGTLAAQHPSSTAPCDPNDAMAIFQHPPKVVLPLHTDPKDSTLLLAAAALRCSRGLLSAQDATPQQVERREEWWRLAAGALVHGVHVLDSESLERLLDLVTEPLLKGSQGRSGVDAVWPELAAALESGLISVLAMLFLSAMRFQRRSGHFTQQIFAACDRAASRDDGLGFAMLVTPLLAYGSTGQAILLLDMLGMHGGLPVGRKARPQSDGLQDPDFVRIAARVAKPNQKAVRQAAASLLS